VVDVGGVGDVVDGDGDGHGHGHGHNNDDDHGGFEGNDDLDLDDDFDGFMANYDNEAANYDENLGNNAFDNEPVDRANLDAIVDAVARTEQRAVEGTNDCDTSRVSLPGTGPMYQYFNLEELTANAQAKNDWAGSAHWKKGARKRDVVAAANQKGSEDEPKTRGKKENFINLLLKVSEAAFAATAVKAVKRGAPKDPYVMTDAAIAKQYDDGNLLPHDSGVGVGQLSRLFLRPNAAVGGKVRAEATAGAAASSSSSSSAGAEAAVGGGGGGEVFADITHDNDLGFGDDNDMGDFGGNDDDDNGYEGGGGPSGDGTHANFMDDDHFNVELEGIRKVEKIEVGYARTSTKVDIKKLKNDLWAELMTHKAIDDSGSADDGGAPVSFKKTQDKLDVMQRQTDASTAYYFICLLHLANEKGLLLKGQDDLNDFTIVKDGYKDPTFGEMPEDTQTSATSNAEQRNRRSKDLKDMGL
jgi:condensin complex subunit 2